MSSESQVATGAVVGGETGPALDKNTENVSGSKRYAYLLRETMRSVTQRARLGKCGHCRIAPMAFVVTHPNGGAYYSGLAVCGSAWCCPVCSGRIAAERAAELVQGLSNWIDAGNGVGFLTLTMPHDYGDALTNSVRTVRRAFRKVLQGRAYQLARASWGIAGCVAALEVTHGLNGWHPHLHILWFFERAPDPESLTRFQEWVFARWAKGIERMGFRAPDPRNCPIERVTGPEVGRYVSKLGAANELVRWDRKKGRNGSHTPFQILSDIGRDRAPVDIGLWHEYESAMFGVQQLTWSKGLRRILGLGTAAEDAEIVEQEAVEGITVAIVSADLWSLLAPKAHWRVELLDEVDAAGYLGGLHYLNRKLSRPWSWLVRNFTDPASIPRSALDPGGGGLTP